MGRKWFPPSFVWVAPVACPVRGGGWEVCDCLFVINYVVDPGNCYCHS